MFREEGMSVVSTTAPDVVAGKHRILAPGQIVFSRFTLRRMLGQGGIKAAALLSIVMGIEVVWAVLSIGQSSFAAGHSGSVSSVANIGQVLFTKHAFAFEVTSVLILVSMIGAVVLAQKEHR